MLIRREAINLRNEQTTFSYNYNGAVNMELVGQGIFSRDEITETGRDKN